MGLDMRSQAVGLEPPEQRVGTRGSWGRLQEAADDEMDDAPPPPAPRAPSRPLKINTDLRLVRGRSEAGAGSISEWCCVCTCCLCADAAGRIVGSLLLDRRAALIATCAAPLRAALRAVRGHHLIRPPSSPQNNQQQYRARLARLMANLAQDGSERRRLLRESEAGLRACLESDPGDPRAYVSLGRILLAQKRYDEARKLYADGTANTGNANPYIWAAWGYLETRAGNVSRARKLFDAAIVVDETHAAAWHKWGMLEMRQGNFLRARDLWTRGIAKCRRAPQKSNTYLYCSLAVMAAELGKLGEARSWFEEGTRTNLGRASCALWHAWAMVEARIGDASAVRFLFKRALQANPRSRYAYLAWGMWERAQGNLAACTQLLARGQQLNPADAALYQARALVAKERGAFDEARAVFRAGVKVDPSHLYLWQAWGVMEYQLGDLAEARRLFQEGVWADPGNRDAVFVFQAWGVLEWKGAANHQLARELFKAALKVDPRNDRTWGTWIQMEEELGRLEAASDLRIRRGEQQWEFVIPSSFTTRPPGSGADGGGGGGGGALGGGTGGGGGVLDGILATINRFFRAWDGASSGGGSGSGAASGSGGGSGNGGGGDRALADMLPEAYLVDPGASPAALAADLVAGIAAAPGPGADGGSGGGRGALGIGDEAAAAASSSGAVGLEAQQQREQQREPVGGQQPRQQRRALFPGEQRERSAVARFAKRPNRPPGSGNGGSSSNGSSSSSSNGSSSGSSNGSSRGAVKAPASLERQQQQQ